MNVRNRRSEFFQIPRNLAQVVQHRIEFLGHAIYFFKYIADGWAIQKIFMDRHISGDIFALTQADVGIVKQLFFEDAYADS